MDVIASGEGYLVQHRDVIRVVDELHPHAAVRADGRWSAARDRRALRDGAPSPWGRDAVVYCADRNFFPGLVASLRSLLHHHPDVPVVVISWGLSAEQESWLRASTTVVPRRPELPDDPTWGRLGMLALDLRRAVYLDADTIVLRPIEGLFRPGAPLAAARNLDWGIAENFRDGALLEQLGLDPRLPAFNAGVLSIDVPRIGARLYDDLVALHRRHGEHFLLGDQSALHLALYLRDYRVEELPVEYNAMAEFWDWTAAPDVPRIVHYAGPNKPWEPGCPYPAQHHFFRHSKIPPPRSP